MNDYSGFINGSDIVGIDINPANLDLSLTFSKNGEKKVINFRNILLFKFSRTIDEDESCFQVYDSSWENFTDGGERVLSELGYAFHQNFTTKKVMTYPGKQIYHIVIEGDVCFDIVCCEILD